MPFQTILLKTDIQTSILEQIRIAFESTANVAATLHGQRKIYQGAFGRRTSLFPSEKCCGAIPLESRLELAHAISLEQDPNILNYRSQALKILLANEQYCYPDFLVQTKDGAYEVHEVKPSIASLSTNDLNRFTILSDRSFPEGDILSIAKHILYVTGCLQLELQLTVTSVEAVEEP